MIEYIENEAKQWHASDQAAAPIEQTDFKLEYQNVEHVCYKHAEGNPDPAS